MMPYIVAAFTIIIVALSIWFIKICLDIRKTMEQPLEIPAPVDLATKAFLEDTIVDTEAPIKG